MRISSPSGFLLGAFEKKVSGNEWLWQEVSAGAYSNFAGLTVHMTTTANAPDLLSEYSSAAIAITLVP